MCYANCSHSRTKKNVFCNVTEKKINENLPPKKYYEIDVEHSAHVGATTTTQFVVRCELAERRFRSDTMHNDDSNKASRIIHWNWAPTSQPLFALWRIEAVIDFLTHSTCRWKTSFFIDKKKYEVKNCFCLHVPDSVERLTNQRSYHN